MHLVRILLFLIPAFLIAGSAHGNGKCPYQQEPYPKELTAIEEKLQKTPPQIKLDNSDRMVLLTACAPANLAHDIRDTKRAFEAGGEVLQTEATYNPDRGVMVGEHAGNAARNVTKVAPGAFSRVLGVAARVFSGVVVSGCLVNIEMWEHGLSHEERVAYFEKLNEYFDKNWTVEMSNDPTCIKPATAAPARWFWTHMKHQMNGASKALETVLTAAKKEPLDLSELDRVDQLTAQEVDRVLARAAARLKQNRIKSEQDAEAAIEKMVKSVQGAELNTVR